MSLSSPQLTNPAEHYFEWKGGDGHIEFYDKERKERIRVPLPFEFSVLDQLNGVTGWSDQDQSGIFSNETRSTRDDFTVRTKKKVLYVGPYKNEQGISMVAGLGGKYIKIIYIAHKNKAGDSIMGRIGLTGAALNHWIDFTKAHSITSGKVRISGKTEEKKGATTFQVPVFEFHKWDDGEYDAAVALDQKLQAYLNTYLTAPKYDNNAEPIYDDSDVVTPEQLDRLKQSVGATPEQVEEFEHLKATKLADKREDEEIKEMAESLDFNDEPIDLADIPF